MLLPACLHKESIDDTLPLGFLGSPLPMFKYFSSLSIESLRACLARTCPCAVSVALRVLQWLGEREPDAGVPTNALAAEFLGILFPSGLFIHPTSAIHSYGHTLYFVITSDCKPSITSISYTLLSNQFLLHSHFAPPIDNTPTPAILWSPLPTIH